MNAITSKARTVPDQVIDVLYHCECYGNELTLPEQLSREDYLAVNKVIEAIGGAWNRKAKCHVFENCFSARDKLDPVLLTGTIALPQDFGFFETPPDLADRVIAAAGIQAGHKVLEPSAGHGALALRAADLTGWVDCIEYRPETCETLRANITISGKFLCSTFCRDFLSVHPGDWLLDKDGFPARYDRVVQNPPFAHRQDISHVTHAMGFLKPSGRLVAIMSAGVAFRTDNRAKAFRQLVDHHNGTITPLPPDSFKSSGTSVQTVLVEMTRD